eukprot:PLAT15299.1.p1 GENE.PLAT15299.1~~PLAT15299.1.p1  ORF type:complete len:420 (-),score=179.21 PLAT15299.1:69-1328(-)
MPTLAERLRPSFHTVKLVEVEWTPQTRRLVLLHYGLMLLLFLYVLDFQIISNHGYQRIEPLVGTSNMKVFGVTEAKEVNSRRTVLHDARDLVVPSRENGASFITTRYTRVPFQTRGTCDEDVPCSCPPDRLQCRACTVGNNTDLDGILTGRCSRNKRCEVRAWCPTMNVALLERHAEEVALPGTASFRVAIRLDGKFAALEESVVHRLEYNLSTIVKAAGMDWQESYRLGAVIYMEAYYDCDLDGGVGADCLPKMKFFHIDDMGDTATAFPSNTSAHHNATFVRVKKGYNFLSPRHFIRGQNERVRDLFHFYGFRFVVSVSGQGRRFDASVLFLNIGASLGILALVTVIMDVIMHFMVVKTADGGEERLLDMIREPLQIAGAHGSADGARSAEESKLAEEDEDAGEDAAFLRAAGDDEV